MTSWSRLNRMRLACVDQHGAAVTSPHLMAPACARRAVDHNPFRPHQMTARATQWRRCRQASRWDVHRCANRRHTGTVIAIPARDMKKWSVLAENFSDDSRSYLRIVHETN